MNISRHSINEVPRYFVPYVNDCFQNTYGALVSYMGLKPELILADYLSFMYDPDMGHIGANFLHRQSNSFVFTEEQLNSSLEYAYFPGVSQFSNCCAAEEENLPDDKIKITLYVEDDQDIAHSRLIELIDREIPVIVVVDLYYMRYHGAYLKRHGAHAVVVTGYNQEEGYVELFDKYDLSKSNFDGRMPVEELILARKSENPLGSYNKPIRNLWMEVRKNSSFFYNDKRWESIITESCSRMYGQKEVLGSKCGLDMIEALRKDLLERKERMQGDELFSFLGYYNEAFRVMSRNRIRFGVFLKEIAEKLKDNSAEEISALLKDSAKRWEIISNLVLRSALTRDKGVIDNICTQIQQIKDIESRAVEMLCGCKKSGE
ncbi:MAG TPA: BtrH N-terminal domain-containing protein [Ruminiclostridium sp.]|nr:BtrH N-terminal domain-containing protein [Ruminiclostridium sp.]